MKLSDFSSPPLIPGRFSDGMLRARSLWFLAIAVALAVLVTACGGGSSKPATTSTSPPTTAAAGRGGLTRAALQAFTTCLQQHGVTVPTASTRPPGETPSTRPPGETPSSGVGGRRGFGFGGGGFGGGALALLNNPADKAAVQACQGKLPAGFLQQQQQRQNQLAAFQSCMKDHGVTVSGGFRPGGPAGPSSTTSTTTPAYAAAFAICKAVLPQGGNFGGPRGATTTTTATTTAGA
jgi:hypothetical protein